MLHKITVSGTLNTWADEETVRRDFSLFTSALERVHPDIVAGSATLDAVETLPESEPTPEPVTAADPTAAILAALNGITARLDRAGL